MNDEQYADWANKIREDYPEAEANRILTQGPGPEQHAATIRAFIDTHEFVGDTDVDAAVAALDALVALAQQEDERHICPVCGGEEWTSDYDYTDDGEMLVDRCDKCGWPPPYPVTVQEWRRRKFFSEYLSDIEATLKAAEERASQLEHERDEARSACNICEQPWPTHVDACAYVGNVADLKQARREADQLRAALEAAKAALTDRASTHPTRIHVASRIIVDVLAGVQAKQRHGRECGCTPCRAEDWDAIDAGLRVQAEEQT